MSEDYNAQEELDPRVELSGDDAVEFETSDEVSAQLDMPQTSTGGTSANKVTADAMADLVVFKLEGQARGTVAVYNKGTANSLTWEILGSLDNGKTFDVPVVAATALAANGTGTAVALTNWASAGAVPTNAVYTHIKVRVRSTTAATPTTAASKAAFATA